MALVPTNEEIEVIKKKILEVFNSQEELFGLEVSELLVGITGGRKVFKDSKVISFLEDLVIEERLLKKQKKKMFDEHEVNVTMYYLPKK